MAEGEDAWEEAGGVGGGEARPQLAGECQGADDFDGCGAASGFAGHATQEVAVEGGFAAVGVEVAFGEFDGFAYHEAYGE